MKLVLWQRESNVSTHSRLKAAGPCYGHEDACYQCFNTQPPEGGWVPGSGKTLNVVSSFNTQPPEGGWRNKPQYRRFPRRFNTQPPEGGWIDGIPDLKIPHVSTHSRLKAAGSLLQQLKQQQNVSTHSRLKAAGNKMGGLTRLEWFQHTAA